MAPPVAVRKGPADAPRGSRLLASIIDSACAIAVYLTTLFAGGLFLMLLGLSALAALQVSFLSESGQTIGKKMMAVKIVRFDTGENGGFMINVLLRGIVNGALGLIPFYALIDVLFIFRRDRRCLHDLIAGTKVVVV